MAHDDRDERFNGYRCYEKDGTGRALDIPALESVLDVETTGHSITVAMTSQQVAASREASRMIEEDPDVGSRQGHGVSLLGDYVLVQVIDGMPNFMGASATTDSRVGMVIDSDNPQGFKDAMRYLLSRPEASDAQG